MSAAEGKCLTCYDSGELVTELGPVVCPDCAGEPGAVSPWGQTERRLRDIEQRYAEKPDVGTEVQWLVFELRRSRAALLRILARCQDAPDEDGLAAEIRFWANDATRMYGRDG
jgi:hypothetical protein